MLLFYFLLIERFFDCFLSFDFLQCSNLSPKYGHCQQLLLLLNDVLVPFFSFFSNILLSSVFNLWSVRARTSPI